MATYKLNDVLDEEDSGPKTYRLSDVLSEGGETSQEELPQQRQAQPKDFVQKLATAGADALAPLVPPAYEGGYLHPSVVGEQGIKSLLPNSLLGSVAASIGGPSALPAAQSYLSKLGNAEGILDKLAVSPVSIPRIGEQEPGSWAQHGAAIYNTGANLAEGFLSPFGAVAKSIALSKLPIAAIGRAGLGAYLGYQGGKGVYHGVTDKNLTPQQREEEILGGGAGLLGGASLALMKGAKPAPRTTEEVRPPALPVEISKQEPIRVRLKDVIDEQFPTKPTREGKIVAANLTDPNFELPIRSTDMAEAINEPTKITPELIDELQQPRPGVEPVQKAGQTLLADKEFNEAVKPTLSEQERVARLQAIEDAKNVNAPEKVVSQLPEEGIASAEQNPVVPVESFKEFTTQPIADVTSYADKGELPSSEIPTALQAAEARIKSNLSDQTKRTNGIKITYGNKGEAAFINPQIFQDVVDFGRHIYDKAKDFTTWSGEMVKRFGEPIRNYLSLAWKNIASSDTYTPVIGAMTDVLRNSGSKAHEVFGNAFDYALNLRRSNQRWFNEFIRPLNRLSNADVIKLGDVLHEEDQTKTVLRNTLPDNLKKAYDEVRKPYRDVKIDQIINNQPVYENGVARQAKVDPTAWFSVISRRVSDILNKTPDSPEAASLKKDFIAHQLSTGRAKNLAQAEYLLKNFLDSSSESSDSPEYFKALSAAEGVGLPKSWIEPDLREAGRRYFQRAALSRAFHDAFQKSHDTLATMGEKVDPWDNPVVSKLSSIAGDTDIKSMLRQLRGQVGSYSPTTNAISRLASNAVLANIVTGLKDTYSTTTGILKYAPSYADIFKHLGEFTPDNLWKAYERTLSTGFNRLNPEAMREMVVSNSVAAEELNKISNVIETYSGRYPLELVSRTIAKWFSDNYAKSYINLARLGGDPHAIKFIQKLFPERNWQDITLKDADEFGTRIGQLMQGRYDATGLPKLLIDNPIAPYAKIIRWNVEQANNFVKYVINPAREGNIRPLLLSTIGPLLAPLTIRKLLEEILHRKDTVPSYTQIADHITHNNLADYSNDEKLVLYRLMADADLAGAGGIFSSIGRSIFDHAYKNRSMGISAPMFTILEDLGQNTGQAIGAMFSGEDPSKVLPSLTYNLVNNNLRLGNLAIRQIGAMAPESDIGKSQKLQAQRDELRQFEQLHGFNYSDRSSPDSANPYTDLDAKKFKQTENPQEMVGALRNIIDENKDNPIALDSKLRGLKNMSADIMPSNEVQRGMYYQYLVRLYGKDKANDIVRDSLRKKAIDEAKRGIVPSLGVGR